MPARSASLVTFAAACPCSVRPLRGLHHLPVVLLVGVKDHPPLIACDATTYAKAPPEPLPAGPFPRTHLLTANDAAIITLNVRAH